MKRVTLLCVILFSIFLMWCGSNNTSYNTWSDDESSYNEVPCNEPNNPYGDWWWHDAWFNWAEETGWECDWNSESFNEWCEEYYSQLEIYENCTE